MLRHDGWRVLEVDAPADVMHTVLSRSPRLVVTSYPAEVEGGQTVTALLRADERTAGLPILSVTSRAFPGDIARAAAAGVSASLVMPVAPTRVVEEVRRLLGTTPA